MPRYLAAWSTKYKFQRWGRDSIGFRLSNPQWTSMEVGFETALRMKGTIAQEEIELTDEDSCFKNLESVASRIKCLSWKRRAA